jgi:4-hydroxy-tetrahydrodipicolinate synthase
LFDLVSAGITAEETTMQISERAPHPRPAGIWIPLVTPFIEGRLDLESVARLTAHYAGLSVDGMIVAATTGEGMTLDEAETAELVSTVAQVLQGRLPLYLGLAGSATATLVRTLERTAAWPVDGYLIACPYYTRPSQEGLFRHFTALADSTDRPILVYNIPYRTGVNLANDTLLRLAQHRNIIGLKDCCADVSQSADLLRRQPESFAVMTGEDGQFFLALAQGARGGILAAAQVRTAEFAAVYRAWTAGDVAGARDRWSGLVDAVRLLFSEPSPAPIKHWLWCEGLIRSPELRLPMTGVSERLAADIAGRVRQAAGATAAAQVA